MKVFWNDLKLKFKEQLRVVGKYDLNKPNDYLVKRRKFRDIDITKDFEMRLIEKGKIDQRVNIENKQIKLENMSLTELESYRENMKGKENEEKESDLYKKIVLRDVQKMCVLTTIKTHEFFDKFFEDTQLHPEMRKNLEIIEHQVKYNLPVAKELLFMTMPELFMYEIGRLTEDERKRFRRRRYELSASDGVLSTGEQYQMALLNQSYEVDKINEMNFYLHFQRKDFFVKYEIFLEQAITWGWETPNAYLYSLTKKNKEKLTCMEILMLDEINEHKQIETEIMTLQEAYYNREPEWILPFPMEDDYKRQYLAILDHITKFKTLDMRDTMFVPYEIPEESFMDRLKKLPDVDIDEEIRLSSEKILKTINSGLPIRGRDMNVKDPELIRQINIISRAVKVESPVKQRIGGYEMPLDYLEEGMLGQTPTEGRILIEEYYKVLYLNNEDPEKYNFTYWEKYFNVSKVTLRNIFNYIFFPMPDEKNPTEVGKILYFKDIDFGKRREMIAEMSHDEYKDYLAETEERPELQEVNRLEYLVYQTTSTEPRITDRTVPTDDAEIEKRIDHTLIYSDVIKEVDERIQRLVQGELENSTNVTLLEKDIQIKIEQIKLKRLQHDQKANKELEDSSAAHSKEDIKNILSFNDEIKLIKEYKQEPEIIKEEIQNESRGNNTNTNTNSSETVININQNKTKDEK